MHKVLVPTDFSAASRPGLRFALQWARQQKTELLFVHVMQIVRPPMWSDIRYNAFLGSERIFYQRRMDKFLSEILQPLQTPDLAYSSLILDGVSPDTTIAEYCRRHPEITFICMGTRGAGKIKRIFGTNTGNLITHSTVPVIAVQKNYKTKPITRLLYATDLGDQEKELKTVVALASSLDASLDILHFILPGEIMPEQNRLAETYIKKFRHDLNFGLKTADITRSLTANLQREIEVRKPSLVVMFTDRDRTLFQKIFLPSNAERLSFQLKVPLLVFGKKTED